MRKRHRLRSPYKHWTSLHLIFLVFSLTLSSHRGCKCPAEFFGPHCEFLKFLGTVDETTKPNESTVENAPSSFVVAIFTLMSLSVVLLGALVVYKLKARSIPREITLPPTSQRRGYDDTRYNGRHVSYPAQNMHSDTIFEEIYIN
jgi:hypothetical protein